MRAASRSALLIDDVGRDDAGFCFWVVSMFPSFGNFFFLEQPDGLFFFWKHPSVTWLFLGALVNRTFL